MDYGTTATIWSDHLLYLHKDFGNFPAQALRGCLDFIRPTNGTWMYDSCKYFADNVLQRTIYAKITSIHEKVCSSKYLNPSLNLQYNFPFVSCTE